MSLVSTGHRVSVEVNEMFWKWIIGGGYTTL